MKNISPSPSIPQTPKYLALFIPCLNFGPTNQAILQENSKKDVSLPNKKGPRKKKKKGGRIKEQKRKNLICQDKGMKSSKKEDESSRLVGETLAKKVKMEITISYSAKSDMWLYLYPHITCICTIFQSLISLLTPFNYIIPYQP
jgi:hypothetical protein